MWRLDCAQGLGQLRRQNPLEVWRGASAPPSPPTHQTPAGPSSFLNPTRPQGPSPSKAPNPSSSPPRALPSPLPFCAPGRLLGNMTLTTSPPMKAGLAFVSLLSSPHSLLLTSPDSAFLTLSKKVIYHGPSTVLEHSSGPGHLDTGVLATSDPGFLTGQAHGHLLAFVYALPLLCTLPCRPVGACSASHTGALGFFIPALIIGRTDWSGPQAHRQNRGLHHSAGC